MLFTDGVVEGRSHGSFFDTAGIRRELAESHRSAHDVVTALGASVLAQSGGRLNDDVAAVAIRLVDPTEETVAQ
ncbi:MAG: serine/threonine-protein phosphatase [Actinomycetota bacterium]|nr:serine/threonine-protein phosphatase [Actinomycetota bacterium]